MALGCSSVKFQCKSGTNCKSNTTHITQVLVHSYKTSHLIKTESEIKPYYLLLMALTCYQQTFVSEYVLIRDIQYFYCCSHGRAYMYCAISHTLIKINSLSILVCQVVPWHSGQHRCLTAPPSSLRFVCILMSGISSFLPPTGDDLTTLHHPQLLAHV